IAPFVVTLAVMSISRGFAMIISNNQAIDAVPQTFSWLSMGKLLGVPNSVVIMILLYILAHVLMSQTVLGRYIYAVGGNREAARLSGVPVKRVLLFVYTLCGALAGLGGALEAAKLASGSPLYGNMYELYVIAAVVVGGTSLAGGEGKILNSLIGALIIAVIQTGMNQMYIESNWQLVVMGSLILAAVLVDMLKKRGWRATFSR
ncbi:MAG: ABC transporter permease, partial [Planctomycetota bacterium]|nr:ABC transporter permease [Planctomycetota bacterium]